MLIIQDKFVLNFTNIRDIYLNDNEIEFYYNDNDHIILTFDDENKAKEAFNKILEYYKNNEKICFI